MDTIDLSLEKLLSFKSDEGKIYLDNLRTILMETDAMGTLRKDLISSLGMERAKGFLLRYGWNCGAKFATNVDKMFTPNEKIDWFKAGMELHTLTGQVLVEPIEVQINEGKGDFYCEGYWRHSYEAEQHIKQFGLSNESVCWTLLGWAGGFSSYYFGKKVIYKEVECIGKGDPFCRWVGRTIDEWESEIHNELPFYQEESIVFELEKAYHRIERQKEDLKNVLRINDQLSNVLIQGDGFPSIVKVLGQNLDTTVVLEDKHFNPISSYGNYKEAPFLPSLKVLGGKQNQKIHRLMEEKKITKFSVLDEPNKKIERLVSPILLKNEVCGYLSIIKNNNSAFNEVEIISLERTASICAAQFLNERTAIETEQRIRGEFLNEMLLDNPNIENLSYRMKVLGYNLEKPYYVFVFDLVYNSGNGPNREADLMEIRKKLEDTIQEKLKTYEKNCFVSSRLDKIIAVIPERIFTLTSLTPKSFGELLINFKIPNFTAFDISLGVSSCCNGIHSFQSGYQEALKSIRMLQAQNLNSNVISFDELGSLGRLLLHAKNDQELENFAKRTLNELVSYDRENDGELLKTLYFFLENQGNIHKTARQMMLSIGAIRYRIKRVQEISNLDMTNAKDYYDTHLSLQILLYYGIFKL